jgi:hypothetical protein
MTKTIQCLEEDQQQFGLISFDFLYSIVNQFLVTFCISMTEGRAGKRDRDRQAETGGGGKESSAGAYMQKMQVHRLTLLHVLGSSHRHRQ